MKEKIQKVRMTDYEGVLTTTNPTKIGVVLNTILHNPSSALIIEPMLNEYWIFYYGGASFPPILDKDISYFKKNDMLNERIVTLIPTKDNWIFEIVKFEDTIQFFNDIMNILNTVKNKSSIKIAIEQPDKFRKFYIYYKN
jgi:hypothetical protein